MKLKFTKMQGIGNDFVVLDGVNQVINLSQSQYQSIANRYFGVGCDQILLVEASDMAGVDFRYRIFNADGSEVEQCGNGARCFALFVREKQLTDKNEITVATKNGVIVLNITQDGLVTVDMGPPRLVPVDIPFDAPKTERHYQLQVDGEMVEIGAVSMGNPHGVLMVDDVDTAPVETLGKKLESHKSFPARANIGFMQIVSENKIRLRVYERGSGETLACGSGACAAVVVGRMWGLLSERVEVSLPGGELVIRWAGDKSSVMLTGPAEFVFDGEINI
ncbi:MAG: diaminopimelate epimerase [Gammaproteobacteria bacterium]|nr:diaminopimelate epimerase [Gammaproteobacteria bacterium]